MALRHSLSPESQPSSSVCTKSPCAVASATLLYVQREQTVWMWLEDSASVLVCGVFPCLRWNCLEVCTRGTLAWASLTTLNTRFFSFSDQSNFLDGCQVFDSNPDWISQSFKVEKQRSRLMLSCWAGRSKKSHSLIVHTALHKAPAVRLG